VFNVTYKIHHYWSIQTKPKLVEHNTQDERKEVYVISGGHAFALVARAVADFVLEAGFVFVFEAGALATAFAALTAAAFAAGFLASAFLLETFLGFVAVVAFFVVVFFEETLVAAFLTTGFEDTFALVLLGFSAVPLDVAFEFSAAGFFTAFVAFLNLSPVEDGFLVVVTLFLVEGGFLFSFVVLDDPLYSLTLPDLPFGRVNISPSPLAIARLKCAMFAAVGSRPYLSSANFLIVLRETPVRASSGWAAMHSLMMSFQGG